MLEELALHPKGVLHTAAMFLTVLHRPVKVGSLIHFRMCEVGPMIRLSQL